VQFKVVFDWLKYNRYILIQRLGYDNTVAWTCRLFPDLKWTFFNIYLRIKKFILEKQNWLQVKPLFSSPQVGNDFGCLFGYSYVAEACEIRKRLN